MLRLDLLSCGYGPMQAVHQLDLEAAEGSITALLGANGAGKSSTIMCIAGHVEVHNGGIRYKDKDIIGYSPMRRIQDGIAIVPEGRRLFPSLSVRENLVVGGYSRSMEETRSEMENVLTLFPRLGERMDQQAGSLSGGEQQMLAIGRALMSKPDLLLVDELSLGLMPKVIDICYQAIADRNSEGLTIILVEQSTHRALEVADQVCVLESGKTVWKGTSKAAKEDVKMIDSLLGLREDMDQK